jgi:hypothetical protein
MTTLFLDTTIQADKFLANKDKKAYIKEICKDKKLISSTYVLGEFKSTFVKDAILLYNLINDCETVGEAVKRFENHYKSRVASRMAKLFGNLLEECENNKEEILDRLDIYIEDLLVKRFNDGIEKILINTTKCSRAFSKPLKEGGVWEIDVSCRQTPPPKCNIEFFLLEDKIYELKKLIHLPDDFIKLKEVLKEICDNNALPFGNNCRTLGDAIIIIEVPDDAKVFSTNIKDFKPICELLNRNLA